MKIQTANHDCEATTEDVLPGMPHVATLAKPNDQVTISRVMQFRGE